MQCIYIIQIICMYSCSQQNFGEKKRNKYSQVLPSQSLQASQLQMHQQANQPLLYPQIYRDMRFSATKQMKHNSTNLFPKDCLKCILTLISKYKTAHAPIPVYCLHAVQVSQPRNNMATKITNYTFCYGSTMFTYIFIY